MATKLTKKEEQRIRAGASLQDQFKTTGQRAREKGIVVGSNGSNVGQQFNGNLGISAPFPNQADAVVKAEPAPAGSPFFLAGGVIPPDLGSAVNNTSVLDPAGVEDGQSKDGPSAQAESQIRPNPLNEFLNYTYNIKFGIMTPEMLNAFSQGNYESLNQNILISSGGTEPEQRANYFDTDFYIDNLQMNSVVGLNQVTGGANTTSIDFTITEPNGLTFFNRLLSACAELGIKNYMDVPYFLKVQFQGYDDIEDSNAPKKSSVPFITPIKITAVENTVTNSGGEYQVTAVAFYDSALFSNECSIHQSFSSKAKTVGDFFDELTVFYNNYYKKSLEAQKATNNDIVVSEDFYHTIKFEVDEEIRNAPIKFNVDLKSADKTNMVPTPQGGFAVTGASAYIDSQKKLPTEAVKIDFSSGTNIIKMINTVITQQSNYIKSQKINPEEQQKLLRNLSKDDIKKQQQAVEELSAKLKQPLSWYKIRNKKIIKNFNSATQKYSRENTFVITKYDVYNRTVENYPGWGETKPVKRYDYIFTGQNDSVLDFSIKFDVMYYQQVLGNPAKSLQASSDPTRSGVDRTNFSKNDAGDAETQAGVQPNMSENTSANIESGQNTEASDYQQQEDRVLAENMYTNSQGDMVEVNLTIIGDPDFLVGYNEEDIAGNSLNLLNSAEEINCIINYKSPQDWDPSTGMLVQSDDPAYFDSAFNGVYKIIEVDSTFSRGKFTQNLNTVRLFNQPGLGTTPKTSGKETKTTGGTAGNPSSFSSGSQVFTGLAAQGTTTQPEQDSPTNNTPVTGTLGVSDNVATSNGSSVGFGLAASAPTKNPTAPATNTAGAGQTSLTNQGVSRVKFQSNDPRVQKGSGPTKSVGRQGTGTLAAITGR